MGIFRDIKIVYFIFLFVLCLNVFVIFMYIYNKRKGGLICIKIIFGVNLGVNR